MNSDPLHTVIFLKSPLGDRKYAFRACLEVQHHKQPLQSLEGYFSYLTSTGFLINERRNFRVTYILVFQIIIHLFYFALTAYSLFPSPCNVQYYFVDFNGHLITPVFFGLNQYLKAHSLSSLMAKKGTHKCLFMPIPIEQTQTRTNLHLVAFIVVPAWQYIVLGTSITNVSMKTVIIKVKRLQINEFI